MEDLPRVTQFLRQRFAVLGAEPAALAARYPALDAALCQQLLAGCATLPLTQLLPLAQAVDADPLELLSHHLADCAPEASDALSVRFDDALTRDELRLVKELRRAAGGPYLSSQTAEQDTKMRQWLESLKDPSNRIH